MADLFVVLSPLSIKVPLGRVVWDKSEYAKKKITLLVTGMVGRISLWGPYPCRRMWCREEHTQKFTCSAGKVEQDLWVVQEGSGGRSLCLWANSCLPEDSWHFDSCSSIPGSTEDALGTNQGCPSSRNVLKQIEIHLRRHQAVCESSLFTGQASENKTKETTAYST